jgi:hypothetical protein
VADNEINVFWHQSGGFDGSLSCKGGYLFETFGGDNLT